MIIICATDEPETLVTGDDIQTSKTSETVDTPSEDTILRFVIVGDNSYKNVKPSCQRELNLSLSHSITFTHML